MFILRMHCQFFWQIHRKKCRCDILVLLAKSPNQISQIDFISHREMPLTCLGKMVQLLVRKIHNRFCRDVGDIQCFQDMLSQLYSLLFHCSPMTTLINHMNHPTDQSPKIPLIHFQITHSFLLPLCFSQQVRSSHGVGSRMKMSNRGDNNSITSDVNTRVDRSVLYSFIHIHPGIMYESLGEYL